MESKVQVLTVAGNDSDGSAGLPADLHAFFLTDVYGMGILTAAVAGNSIEISDQVIMPVEFLKKQFDAIKEDFHVSATKTGMLGTKEIINCFYQNFNKKQLGKLIVDPVIVTKHGNFLLDKMAYKDFVNLIVPMADVITPNIYEAQVLSGMKIKSITDMKTAAEIIQKLGAKNVVIKGSHNNNFQKNVEDVVLTENGVFKVFASSYVNTQRLNGTGDTFSAVITAELAKGNDLISAVETAKELVHQAISLPIRIGKNHGPINLWNVTNKIPLPLH